MRNFVGRIGLTLLLALALGAGLAPQAFGVGGGSPRGRSRGQLGTVTGSVVDHRGKPLAGAIVKFLKEGASEVFKEARTAADGKFTARLSPGRYVLSAFAEGFGSISFNAVQIKPSEELIYRFNLEPLGQGRTAPERRSDRDDPKWRLRANQSRRSIYQADEGTSEVVESAEAAIAAAAREAAADGQEPEVLSPARAGRQVRGVVETYAASSANPRTPGYFGTNFAVAAAATDDLDIILAGQLTSNSLGRFEATGRFRVGDRHRLSATLGGATLPLLGNAHGEGQGGTLSQLTVRAVDEWVVRDGVVVVLGLDYSRFVGGRHHDGAFTPRLGFQFEANPLTRFHVAYAPESEEAGGAQSALNLEGGSAIVFPELDGQAVAYVDGRAVMERSRRLEFGVERVLDENSSVEATAFFDTTDGRGIGLLNVPLNAFATESGAELVQVANQHGAARGIRVVYARRLGQFLKASAGYAFGRGQQLAPEALASASPDKIFRDGFFQTAAAQLDASFDTGTHVRTVLRFSSRAAVFAIDPFAGRLAVFDPSLSILVTQDLPTFGLPVRAEAVVDARNLLDAQADDGEALTLLNGARRIVRGGISVRF
ncbi:MAG: carboxypeptidase regulatory-like domain-containing protein [Pyrinomonadaceae bacterium]